MSKVITIKEANISTLSVELKAIHINAKQMTLSVFRQIQEEDLIDDQFHLLGVPWGNVNYFWDKSPQLNSTVLHVVWQKGKELRRWRFTDIRERFNEHYRASSKLYTLSEINHHFFGKEYRELSIIDNFISGKTTYEIKIEGEYHPVAIKNPSHYEKNGQFEILYPHAVHDYEKNKNEERELKYIEAKRLLARDIKRKAELEPVFAAQQAEAAVYIENWRKTYQQLAALPQLYIAA